MTDDIVFEDPPSRDNTIAAQARRVATALRARPGEWARVYGPETRTRVQNFALNFRQGRYKGVPQGDFESVTKTEDDGQGYVWARYIGNGADQ